MSIEIQTCMSIDKQYVHRHTRSTLNQVTSIQASFYQSVIAERTVRKNANILIFVPKVSIIALHKRSIYSSAISCYYMLSRKIMCADRHTVSRLTYSISIDIHGVYVNRDTVRQSRYVCRSRYCMTIGCCASHIFTVASCGYF